MDFTDFGDWLLAERDLRVSTANETLRHMRRLDRAGITWEVFLASPDAAKRCVRPIMARMEAEGKRSMKRALQKTLNRYAAYLAVHMRGPWQAFEWHGPWRLSSEPRRRFDPYTDAEMAQILAYDRGTPFVRARRRAMLALLRYLGERRSQVWAFRVEDFDAKRSAVLIRAPIKGGEPRWENVPPVIFHPGGDVASWLIQRARVADPRGALWVTSSGKPMSRAGFSGDLYKVRRHLGIPLNFNRFRHTRGLESYRANLPVQIQQDEWGHSDPKSTLWYMRAGPEERARILRASGLPGWG